MRTIFGSFGAAASLARITLWSSCGVCFSAMVLAQPAPPAPTAGPVPAPTAPVTPNPVPPAAQAPAPAPPTPPAAPEEPPADAKAPPAQAAPAPALTEPPVEPEPTQAPEPVAVELEPPPIEPIELEPPSEEIAAEPAAESDAWYQKVSASVFADGYFGMNYHVPKPQQGRNRFRAFDSANGFALAVAGLDLAFNGDEFGGTVDLRFGPTALAIASDDAELGLWPVKQAYATWRPGGADGSFTLDFGKFNTIYGAEVAESHLNFNYTRGLMYSLGQPRFHTGLRATAEFSPQLWLTAMAVNGWNNSYDNNLMKSFGLQLSTSMPSASDPDAPPLLDAHIGYLVGPEQPDIGFVSCPAGTTFDPSESSCNNARPENAALIARDAGEANSVEAFRHLVDLVVGIHPSRNLSLLFNGDIGFEGVREGGLDAEGLGGFANQLWWGVAAMGRYQFDPAWAAALRGEVYGDPDGRATSGDDPYVQNVQDLQLYSATLTFEYVPVSNLILRLDTRFDFANEDVFPEQLRSYGSLQATSTLGVVVTSE